MFTRMHDPVVTLTALACVAGQPTLAARTPGRQRDRAVGEIKAKPDTVVFTGMIAESSQKMKDAATAFRDTRRRALAAVEGLEIENLSVSAGALSISVAGNMAQADPFGGEAKPMPEGTLTLTQSVSLTVTGLDKMEDKAVIDLVVGIIEAAREAGIKQVQTDQRDDDDDADGPWRARVVRRDLPHQRPRRDPPPGDEGRDGQGPCRCPVPR